MHQTFEYHTVPQTWYSLIHSPAKCPSFVNIIVLHPRAQVGSLAPLPCVNGCLVKAMP